MQERIGKAAGLRLTPRSTVLITGPVRSGKSTFALQLARTRGRVPVFVATARVDDGDVEMTDRVRRHRAERGAMRTIEVDERTGPSLCDVLDAAAIEDVVIVDSLGTWLGNFLRDAEERANREPLALAAELNERARAAAQALRRCRADAIVVSEETGWGIVPPFPLGRIFRDVLGRLTASVARDADRAYLVVAGFAVDLRSSGVPIGD